MTTMNPALRVERAREMLEEGRPEAGLAFLRKGVPPGLASERAHLRAECLRAVGDLGGCRPWYEKALAGTDRTEDPVLWLESCLGLVSALRSLGECSRARKLLAQGVPVARKRRLADFLERLRLEEVLLDRAEGLYSRSMAGLKTFLAMFRERKDPAAAGYILWAMGGARRFSGDLAGSRRDYRSSLALCVRARDPMGQGYAMLGLGGVERIRGNLSEALGWYGRARKVFAPTQDLFARAYCECGLGNCLRQMGRTKEAAKRYAASHRLYSAIGDPVDLAYVDWGQGKVAMQEGRPREAERRLKLSLAGFSRFHEHRGVVLARMALAAALHSQGRTKAAERLFDQGLALARRTGLHAHLEVYT